MFRTRTKGKVTQESTYDETTGYWNAGARMYNCADRTFIQKDPEAGNITEPMTQNGYI